MKKEIMELISAPEGSLRINHISTLRRWTEDGLGQKGDWLTLNFDKINGIAYPGCVGIKSRDYDGIIAECQEKTEMFMKEVTRRITGDLRAGHITKGRRA